MSKSQLEEHVEIRAYGAFVEVETSRSQWLCRPSLLGKFPGPSESLS